MQDCKVAARIRANATVKAETTVASPKFVTVKSGPRVTKPVDATVKVISTVASFEHPNVYPDPATLGWDKQAKTSTQRSREMRQRQKQRE